MKKSNYAIPELGAEVKDKRFKIVNVFTDGETRKREFDYRNVKVPYQELMAHLFETRNALDFPDEAMVNQIRLAVRDEILPTLFSIWSRLIKNGSAKKGSR